jgi:hypothetical protein
MPAKPHGFDPFRVLSEHAAHLNGITAADRTQPPFYELMSGALVWRDETRPNTPTEVIWALRFLCAYRTSLMLGEPRAELATIWEHSVSLFPKWVGFLPERRASDPELLAIYRRGNLGLRKCLRDMEAAEADA